MKSVFLVCCGMDNSVSVTIWNTKENANKYISQEKSVYRNRYRFWIEETIIQDETHLIDFETVGERI